MKKTLIVALILGLALVFAVGCGGDSEPEVEVVEVEQEAEVTTEGTAENGGGIQELVDTQNEMFAAISTDEMTISVSAEGTVLTYTYVYSITGLDADAMQDALDSISAEGQMMLTAAQAAAPEVTAVILEFLDTEGNTLGTSEFN